MKYVLVFRTYEYGADEIKEFDTQEEMLNFINQHAENEHFNVAYCAKVYEEYKLNPVEKVKKYELTPR